MPSRRLTGFAATLLLAFVAILVPGAAETRAQRSAEGGEPGTVHVEIFGFRHDRGAALVALYRSKRGFPDEGRHALARKETRIRNGRGDVCFTRVPPGPFAVSVLHDEDGDHEMDTNFFGIPQEGYGVSRNAVRKFGPPRFREAVLRLRPGERKTLRIPVHY